MFGAVERGGRVVAKVMPDALAPSLGRNLTSDVLPASMIYTDEATAYRRSTMRKYKGHRRSPHHAKIYVDGDVHTQTIEGFFGLLNGIRGVYHSVSAKHLQSYLDEYTFRYNRRDQATPMFWAILDRVQKRPALPVS